jgi:TPR repeat protein
MTRRWTTFFAAVVLVASLACGAVPGAEDDPVSSNSTGDFDVEEEQFPSSFEALLEQAEQGDAEAQYELGLNYNVGIGAPLDDAEAARWFRLAADQGLAGAQVLLGALYKDGAGVPQDYAEALRWFRLAADQGEAVAQNELGLAYFNGLGVPQDYAEAVRWFRLATEQRHYDSLFSLGVMYGDGLGVPQDHVQAARLYRLAAEEGHGMALYNLGLLYERGFGVTQDTAQAYMWFNLAVTRLTGREQEIAASIRDRTFDQITPGQRAEAQRLAREWDEAHPRFSTLLDVLTRDNR